MPATVPVLEEFIPVYNFLTPFFMTRYLAFVFFLEFSLQNFGYVSLLSHLC
jgi:hypothetical protein